jgi:N-acetyl-anhydromuramyl-L-alanine amidase AmpD
MTGYSKATWVPSPNFFPGRKGMAVTTVVLHATAGPNAVQWFQNPASQVSAAYVVGEDASVTQCVDENDSAWHAGIVTPNSAYYGGPNPNYFSIGIEHERNVANDNPMPEAQIVASLALVADILRRYGPLTIITHDQIDVGRVCPGTGFPLDRFLALLQPAPQPTPSPASMPSSQEVETVMTITPAIQAAARLRLYALGGHLVPGGAIETELIARFALGQANPHLATQTPTPVVGSEVALPNGHTYAMLDSGEIVAWENGKLDNPEEKDRAAIIAACWGGKFA